jgi:hypothetical protein
LNKKYVTKQCLLITYEYKHFDLDPYLGGARSDKPLLPVLSQVSMHICAVWPDSVLLADFNFQLDIPKFLKIEAGQNSACNLLRIKKSGYIFMFPIFMLTSIFRRYMVYWEII